VPQFKTHPRAVFQAVTKAARITELQLDFKSGGKSGTYARRQHAPAP
jgi:hypothetical protein